MRQLELVILCLLCVSVINAQDYKLLSWNDLKPNQEFEDPFKKLNQQQLLKLSQLAKLKETASDVALSAEAVKEMKALEDWLSSKDIDYNYLFSVRAEVVEMRKQQAIGVNTTLGNTLVEISGYLLPLNFYNEKANEFLLVPWVAPCIHTPAPPKNQIIYITTKEWMDAVELYDPVLVSGKLLLDDNTSELFLGDGTTKIKQAIP